jgi:predicted nucleic acid-binding protein
VSASQPIIVDTNIIFSALLSGQSGFAELLLKSEHSFYICELVLIEIFRRKEKIINASRLSEEDVIRLLYILLKRLILYKEDLIKPENRKSAYALCKDIDESDTPHVALTLELEGLLWTGDKTLKKGLKQKGFDRFFKSESHRDDT